jgi:hypothetical protein
MSCSAENTIFHEDINGQPMDAGPQGEYGFLRNETDFIFKSEFDKKLSSHYKKINEIISDRKNIRNGK